MEKQVLVEQPPMDEKPNKPKKKKLSKKQEGWIIAVSVITAIVLVVVLNLNGIINFFLARTMGKELPQLNGEPEIGKYYAIDMDDAKSSDGSRWQGYIRKGKENKVIVYFYGGGVSTNSYMAARPLDGNETGYYNSKLNMSLNVMTSAIIKWGIGNSDKDNSFKDWSFIGIPYCNGDFHSGTGQQQYTALDGTTKTMYYNGYNNYSLFMDKALQYIGTPPEKVLITGSSAGGFGASILADDVIDHFPQTEDFTVLIDGSILVTDWRKVMTEEWKSPEKLSSVLTENESNITVESLVALHKKRENVKILFACSVRDFNLSQMQAVFDSGKNDLPSSIGKKEGDRFQALLKESVEKMQTEISNCGIYIWNKETQKDGHLSVHTALGTQICFEKFQNDKSIIDWAYSAVNGNIKTYGLELLDKSF